MSQKLTEAQTAAPPMRAARVHRFGGIDAIVAEAVPRPEPGPGEVLVRVYAAGVGPWDALVRTGNSVLRQPLPLTLGSDLSGVVERVGEGVQGLEPGDAVFGVTNARFTGAYAEYALADAGMIARKPPRLTHPEAASVPVVACTAWQMLFDEGGVRASQRVLVHGAAGNVGAYAVQLAKGAGATVIGTGFAAGQDAIRELGAELVVDVRSERFEDVVGKVDVVVDTVGGDALDRSFAVLRPGGRLVSCVAQPDAARAAREGITATYILVQVTRDRLERIGALLDSGRLRAHVGEVLPLADARIAHEMLAGRPHRPGKIVLSVADGA